MLLLSSSSMGLQGVNMLTLNIHEFWKSFTCTLKAIDSGIKPPIRLNKDLISCLKCLIQYESQGRVIVSSLTALLR